jgi:hypothetical protein
MSNAHNQLQQSNLRDSPVLSKVPDSHMNLTQEVVVRS